MLLDEFCLAYRLKPLALSLEVVPLADNNLYLEDLYYLEWRRYNAKTSILGFLHEPYVAWTIRLAAMPLKLALDEGIFNSRGIKKVG